MQVWNSGWVKNVTFCCELFFKTSNMLGLALISSLYAVFQISQRTQICCFAPGYRFQKDFLLSIYCIHILYLWQWTNPIPPRTETHRHKHTLRHCGKPRRINASGKQGKMNIPEAVAMSVHINTPTHTDTPQQKYCIWPINADIQPLQVHPNCTLFRVKTIYCCLKSLEAKPHFFTQ